VADYHSDLVDRVRAQGYVLTVGDLTFKLAGEFGFCYGVDRAVEYAYETRTKFPDRRVFLVGEIIHNPHVNSKLQAMGVEFLLRPDDGEFDFGTVTAADVVILPAFGVTVKDFERLRAIGCVLVDTTCGSVLNVWKRVDSYAKDGFTAVIHGKYHHEETKATASQVTKYAGGRYLVVRDMAEAHLLVGRIHLRNGRVRDAVDALKISLWSAETAEAHLVLAKAYVQEKEPQTARAEAERALVLDPASPDAKRLLEQLK